MTIWEIVVLIAIVILSVSGIILSIRKNKKKGYCGNCSACRNRGVESGNRSKMMCSDDCKTKSDN